MNLRSPFLYLLFLSTFYSFNVLAQTVELRGEITAEKDLEGIHIINKTSSRFTTTNTLGLFEISAKYQDTILVSSILYKTTTVVVSYRNIQERSIKIYLEELVNVLDEVTVGKILTGDLDSDVENSEAERPIDFYDLGLPGYTGRRLSQNERRLSDADGGNFFSLTTINVYKILNRISGRTKMLKERVRKESNWMLLNWIVDRMEDDFFSRNPLDEKHRVEFWYFCSEDEDFEARCRSKSEIEIYGFLEEKHKEYVINIESGKD